MISFEDLTKLFSLDLKGKGCIEIEFNLKHYPQYRSCWMGKSPDKEKYLYWYGALSDHTESYDYDNF